MDAGDRTSELERRIGDLEQRLQLAEARISTLQAGDGGSSPQVDDMWTTDRFAEVRKLVRSGNIIEAIKLYREQTGVGLREAKDAVDAMPHT
jgi:large subunit ribosomal protein L7/L12